MTIDYSVGNEVTPNLAYIDKILSAQTFINVEKTVYILKRLTGENCEISDISTVEVGDGTTQNVVSLVPVDTSNSLYNLGIGVVAYFSTDDQVNRSLALSTSNIVGRDYVQVYNNTGSSIAAGSVVRQSGFNTTVQLPEISLSSASADSTDNVYGVVESAIADEASGVITVSGDVSGLDTSGFSAIGDVVYLSDTNGQIAASAGTNTIVLGYVTAVGSSGSLRLIPVAGPSSGGGGGGGSGAFSDVSTVGSGGDYATVVAALADSATRVRLISNVTESSAISITGEFSVDLNNYTWTVSSNVITLSNDANLSISGDLLEDSIIVYVGATNELIDGNSTNIVGLSNLTIDNSGSNANCPILSGSIIASIYNIKILLPSATNGGITLSSEESTINGIWLVGPDTDCHTAWNSSVSATNIRVSGTFNSVNPTLDIEGNVINIISDSGLMLLRVSNGGNAVNVLADGASPTINATITDGGLINANLGDGTLSLTGDDSEASNIRTTGDISLQSGVNAAVLSNSYTEGNLTIQSDDSIITGVRILGSVTVSSGAIGNRIDVVVGAKSGGGSNTVTLAAGANNNLVTGLVDAAISDSGTGNNVSTVVVY